jgi:F-type H+-transporting ATPase subunit delta
MPVAQRIYAKALFDAAKSTGRLAEVRASFGELVEAAEASPDLRNVLRNPQIDVRAKRGALDALFAEDDEVFRGFLRLCADKGRLAQIEEIHAEFERLVAEEERVLSVELTTAQELSEPDAAEILEQIARVSGRRVEATIAVDPSLIGGIVLRAGSFLADASVRGRLNSLRQQLELGR